jgi:hypothetical protein
MTDSNIKHLALLGKEVSFCFSSCGVAYQTDGQVTSLVLHLHGDHEISVDDDCEFYSFSELTEFKILGSDPVGDAFEALITDNKDFIDSLSNPTL